MTKNMEKVVFYHAKIIAECYVLEYIYNAGLQLVSPAKILEDTYLESEIGWIFFGNKENFVLPELLSQNTYFACMVNQKGECHQIVDFFANSEEIVGNNQNWKKNTISNKRENMAIAIRHAQKIAESSVLNDICRFNLLITKPIKLLEDNYLEAECCWIFLRNKEIVIPLQNWFAKSYGAYAVSKKGTCNIITHFPGEPERLKAYLETMSDYFKKSGK
jgi:hypothetical protein